MDMFWLHTFVVRKVFHSVIWQVCVAEKSVVFMIPVKKKGQAPPCREAWGVALECLAFTP
jgi:hypothetical protein